MPERELIRRCLADEGEAWGELWRVIEDAILVPVRRACERRGLDLTLADDFVQELYFHLRADDYRLLRAFQGTSRGELRAFLRQVALGLASNLARGELRRRRRETRALQAAPMPDRSGPTEAEIAAFWQELRAALPEDMEKIEQVIQWTGPEAPAAAPQSSQGPSDRTLRRWWQDIKGRFGDLFGGGRV
jgi:DNA-directed RNA polymerase specialized sigma24 family protein